MGKKKVTTYNDLVFEIGIEELPSDYFDCIYVQKNAVDNYLKSSGLIYEDFILFLTPRRIVIYLSKLQNRQQVKEELIKGPSYEKSFDSDGKPTRALEGFMQNKGITQSDIFEHEGRVAIHQKTGGAKVEDVLKNVLPAVLDLFTFPRAMAWNDSGVRFPRPIRWLFCMYGTKKIAVAMAGLEATERTYGHRFIAKGVRRVKSAKEYFRQIKEAKIILSEEERISSINAQLKNIAVKEKWKASAFNQELVGTVARLCENPFLLVGDFSKDYLTLPQDVLSTCMKKHQKIFACYNQKEKLVPHFIAVLDGKRAKLNRIKAGYENVLDSRLKDAAFFVAQDMKHINEHKDEFGRDKRLKNITYLKGLGSIYDKVDRLFSIASDINNFLRFMPDEELSSQGIESLQRAVNVCKNDLLTHLVYEFPELQGVAGREYLRREGEPEAVACAVSDHYLPKTLRETIQVNIYKEKETGRISAVLGILDRLDTIIGALGIGIEISGSEDPYALRRASGGIVILARAFKIRFSLHALCDRVFEAYRKQGILTNEKEDVLQKALTLFEERMLYAADEKAGSRHHMILNAVLASGNDDICDVFTRHETLKQINRTFKEVFIQAAKVVERTKNILKGTKEDFSGPVDTNLFEVPIEQELYDVYTDRVEAITKLTAAHDYEKATILYAETFYDIVHRFFDEVLINAEDPKVRVNRLRLMKNINDLYTKEVADLGLIHGLD